MFLVDEGRASDDFSTISAHITGLLERHGATVEKIEKWDARRLAYEVNGRKRGTYVVTKFSGEPANIDALRKDCQLSNVIMRAMVLREENVGLPVVDAQMRKPARAKTAAAPAEGAPAEAAPAEATPAEAAPAEAAPAEAAPAEAAEPAAEEATKDEETT